MNKDLERARCDVCWVTVLVIV